jgi:hypothetical protein
MNHPNLPDRDRRIRVVFTGKIPNTPAALEVNQKVPSYLINHPHSSLSSPISERGCDHEVPQFAGSKDMAPSTG